MKIEIGKKYKLTFKGSKDLHETVMPACYAISATLAESHTTYLFRLDKTFSTTEIRGNDIISLETPEETQ